MKELPLEQRAIKALSSNVRVEILRKLDEKQKTLSDLSRELELNKATIYKHVNVLLDADLISRKEREGHKWIYYRLSWKGSSLLHPQTSHVNLILTMSMALLAAGLLASFRYLSVVEQRAAGPNVSIAYATPYLVLGLACISAFAALLGLTYLRFKKGKSRPR